MPLLTITTFAMQRMLCAIWMAEMLMDLESSSNSPDVGAAVVNAGVTVVVIVVAGMILIEEMTAAMTVVVLTVVALANVLTILSIALRSRECHLLFIGKT